jgi:hypothetical protein
MLTAMMYRAQSLTKMKTILLVDDDQQVRAAWRADTAPRACRSADKCRLTLDLICRSNQPAFSTAAFIFSRIEYQRQIATASEAVFQAAKECLTRL